MRQALRVPWVQGGSALVKFHAWASFEQAATESLAKGKHLSAAMIWRLAVVSCLRANCGEAALLDVCSS